MTVKKPFIPEDATVGLYFEKAPISALVRQYAAGLAAIALVHQRGARKYECYSWLNDPNAFNSTPEDNLDAAWRHLSSHSMGKFTDIEGLPHLYHLACRMGMFITTMYRKLNTNKIHVADIRPYCEDTPMVGAYLTPEELFVLSKAEQYVIPDTYEELYPYLLQHLTAYMLTPPDQHILTNYWDNNDADPLFIAAMRFVTIGNNLLHLSQHIGKDTVLDQHYDLPIVKAFLS